MRLDGNICINDNAVYFCFEYIAPDDMYFNWWSNFDYLLFETSDPEKINQIFIGLKKFSQSCILNSKRSCNLESVII